ncbi:hypothetical protein [Streptomyces sp. NPDC059788]|uniref:hypothetical protein n=1 Tax=Streptomyces sp. NPDC059788 TaxID=3346948 RepID=UPI003669DF28
MDAEPLLRGLYEQFRAVVGHVPDDTGAFGIVQLLHSELPDAAHWCSAARSAASARPRSC